MTDLSSLTTLAAVPTWLVTWGTPIWLIAVGALTAVLILLVIWGVTALISRRVAANVPGVLAEGVLLPISVVIGLVALLSLPGMFVVDEPLAMIKSVFRLPAAGSRYIEATVPVAEGQPVEQRHPITVNIRGDELTRLRMQSDQLVAVADAEESEQMRSEPVEIAPSDPYEWLKARQANAAFNGDFVRSFYVSNFSELPANLQIEISTAPAYPEAATIVIACIAVLAIFILYFLQASLAPRTSAIALATAKSEIAQPLFPILIALGIFFLLLFLYLPYNTFGEDIKMLKDSGLTLIMVLAIIQGIWAASNSVAEEIEGRTALTVLSKPIGRRSFILGKWLGILWTVFVMFLILGTLFVVIVAYKPIYDAREMGSESPLWDVSHLEVTRTVPGLVLAYFETVVLVSISVAISTRLPLLANFVICFSIYVLGHLTPLIVQSPNPLPPVVFIGQFIATILPLLDHFNIQAAVAAGAKVPLQYLGAAFAYCLLYSAIALLVALALFEDRDLA